VSLEYSCLDTFTANIHFSFSSVVLGLPKNIKDDDVHCEYPVDADDEYVTERGFQPTLPGESTKLSSALALFKASRILSKVLEEVYPAKASYDLSLKKLSDLSDELDNWHSSLPQHLRLPFAQDKPTVGTISSRSPILSMTYHYIRALIQRPAVCASLGSRSSSAMLALAGSSKSIVQVIQLLQERGLSFSFCLNKDEVLVLSGFGLLFQRLTLDPNSKILKESQKMVAAVVDILTKSEAPCAPEFSKIAKSFLPTLEGTTATKSPVSQSQPKSKTNRHSSEVSLPASRPHSLQASTKKQLKALASRFSPSPAFKAPEMGHGDRRATVPTISLHPHAPQTQSQPSLSPQQSFEPVNISRSEPALSPNTIQNQPNLVPTRPLTSVQQPAVKSRKRSVHTSLTNLDYLSFGNDHATQQPVYAIPPIKTEPQPTDWEKLLGSLDNGQTNIYDACYGGQPIEALLGNYNPAITHRHSTTTLNDNSSSALDWNADLWNLYQTNTNASAPSAVSERAGHNGSIWSYSTDEGTASAEDLTVAAANWSAGSSDTSGLQEPIDNFPGIVLPDLGSVGEDLNFPFNEWGDVGA
jgi:hypothetical protein